MIVQRGREWKQQHERGWKRKGVKNEVKWKEEKWKEMREVGRWRNTGEEEGDEKSREGLEKWLSI